MAPHIQEQYKAKNKHVTKAYSQLLADVLLMFDTPRGYKEQIGVKVVPGIIENVAEASNMDLLNNFYTELTSLAEFDMSVNYNRQNDRFKVTQPLEDLEARMETIAAELERRRDAFKASTGYNRTEGRFYEYITNILNQYKDVQDVMDNIEEPFQRGNEFNAANEHETEYLNAQAEFTQAVLEYNQVIDSPSFSADDLPETVKLNLHGANFTPESLLDKADLDSILSILDFEVDERTKEIFEAEQERSSQINKEREDFRRKAQKRTEDFNNAIKEEKNRFNKLRDDTEREAKPLFDKILEKRPEEAEKQFRDNLEAFGKNDYSKVREEYKVSLEDINKEMSLEELTSLEEKLENQLRSLDSRSSSIKKELVINESEKEIHEVAWNDYKDLETVEDSEDYKRLTALEEEKQVPIDVISSKIDMLSISGPDAITQKFLKENKIDLQAPENKKRSKTISEGTKAIYDAIGRSAITRRWTPEGESLNVAAKKLHYIFISDFQELGWDNLIFGTTFTEDDLNDLENLDIEGRKTDDVPKPFEMTEELKNDFFDLNKLLIDAYDETNGLKEFGYFTNRTSPKEALVTAKLVERREDFAKFAKSINPLLEEDEQKQKKLINIKTDIQEAVRALEKIAKNQKVMDALQKVSDAMQPSEEELAFKKQVQEALEAKREVLRKQKGDVTAEKERLVNGFASKKRTAQFNILHNENERDRLHDEQEQIKKDVDHLSLAKSIIAERKNQAKLKAEQVAAQKEIDIRKEQGKKETEKTEKLQANMKIQYQKDIQEMKKDAEAKLKRISQANEKLLSGKKQKKTVLSNFMEKITNLEKAKKKLEKWAVKVGEAHHTLDNNKNAGIRRLGEQHRASLLKMDISEKNIYDNLAQTKRWRFNSAEYNRMLASMKAYLDLKTENPNIDMTGEEYQTLVSDVRRDIEAYTTLRDKNNGVKRTDVGQQRLDGAYNFLKLLEKREAMITQYHFNVKDIARIHANQIYTKTRAEEVILGKQEVQPEHEPTQNDVGHTFNIVGNPAVREEFSGITDAYFEPSPLLTGMLNTAINSLIAGNGKALGEIVAISITLQISQRRKMNEEQPLSEEKTKSLVEKLQDMDVVKNVVNQTLNGNIKCSEIIEEVSGEEFSSALFEETNRRQNPAPNEEVKKDTKIVGKEEEAEVLEEENTYSF